MRTNAEQVMARYKRKAEMEAMWMDGKNCKEIADHFGIKKLPKYFSVRELKMKKLRHNMAKMCILPRLEKRP